MARQMMILMSMIILIETLCIISSNGAPMIFVGFPINHQEIPAPSLSSFPITEEENIKRVHRRELNNEPESMEQQLKPIQPAEDDLETAAGTNLMRPLFVYRQQIADRDRNIKRLADRRRAISDGYY